jgi:hypothetical protein
LERQTIHYQYITNENKSLRKGNFTKIILTAGRFNKFDLAIKNNQAYYLKLKSPL